MSVLSALFAWFCLQILDHIGQQQSSLSSDKGAPGDGGPNLTHAPTIGRQVPSLSLSPSPSPPPLSLSLSALMRALASVFGASLRPVCLPDLLSYPDYSPKLHMPANKDPSSPANCGRRLEGGGTRGPHPTLSERQPSGADGPPARTISLEGGGRWPSGATALKRRRLARAGWRMVAVPYWEGETCAGPEAQAAFLSYY